MGEYAGLGLFALLGSLAVGTFLVLTSVLGPKLVFDEKQEPFECGEHQLASPNQRFSIKFYMVAVSFIIFDVEVVFLFPWAVVFKDFGWYGLAVMTPFLAVLAVGLAYEWLRGGLDWE
ncbi:MAG TPA: NADH-quinone oxidoreductase subunit A [Myxococcota bacterium]|nr:NADH-quinone oxidoreductase subunit A [Myxococcota bacterium]